MCRPEGDSADSQATPGKGSPRLSAHGSREYPVVTQRPPRYDVLVRRDVGENLGRPLPGP